MSNNQQTPFILRVIPKVIEAPSYLAIAMLFFLMVITFFDVILRSVANNPIERPCRANAPFNGNDGFCSTALWSHEGAAYCR